MSERVALRQQSHLRFLTAQMDDYMSRCHTLRYCKSTIADRLWQAASASSRLADEESAAQMWMALGRLWSPNPQADLPGLPPYNSAVYNSVEAVCLVLMETAREYGVPFPAS